MTLVVEEPLAKALAALANALAELDVPAMIIGGIAVIARGVPRQTVDIDAALWPGDRTADELLAQLARHEILPRIPEPTEFARRRQILLMEHAPTGTPLDISLSFLPFEREALARASTVDFGGIDLRVAQPEDLIVYKAVAWRERDKADIERLLLIHRDTVDLVRVRHLVQAFAEALGDPQRVVELEELLSRHRLGET